MSPLAQQQQALLALLFASPRQFDIQNIAAHADPTWARGIKVYQANGHALAASALRAAYPVLQQLLGDESFDALARALWHAHPPRCGDAARWGDTLAGFVQASAQLADVPYLPDVARLEWLLHTCASAADAEPEPASFALLGAHQPEQLCLHLSPGSATLASRWPVADIVNAHLQPSPDLTQVGQLLREGIGQDALVWRSGWRALVRQAQPGEAAFVAALLHGQTLAGALDQAQALDIGDWLPMAVQTGLLLGVRLADKAHEKTPADQAT